MGALDQDRRSSPARCRRGTSIDNIGITKFKDDPSLTDAEIATIAAWVDAGAPMGNPADMPQPRQFSDLDTWFIGKPDIVVTMDKPYVLPADGPDNIVDVLVDPGFKEDMYVMAIESKPADPRSFKVVHHFTTNLVEDPEEDPVGLFLNEYALGKNGDVFPPDSGRLIKAGTKINFNLHLNPRGEETPVSVKLGLKVFPKGRVPKYVAFTQHMGDASELDIPAGQLSRHDGYFRLSKPALLASFQPHMHNRGKAQCIEAIYPDLRADSARPGPARVETISLRQQLSVRLAHHLPVRRRCRAAAAGRHDRPRHLLARQHDSQQVEPESEELGRLRRSDRSTR